MSSESADVRSIDAIDRFRVSVVEFIDAGRVSITEADSDLDRNIIWLKREQTTHWIRQIRKRQELVTRAKSKLYRKQMQTGTSGGQASVVDEKIALKRALLRLEEAQSKLRATRKWIRRLDQERHTFKAAMSSFSAAVDYDLPHAVGLLKKITENLESYLNLSPPDLHRLISPDGPTDEHPSMRRTGETTPTETVEEARPTEEPT